MAAFGGSYFAGDSRIGAALVHYDARYGIPGEDSYIAMKQTKGMLRSSLAIDTGAWKTLDLEAGHADYEHSERDQADEPLATFINREWDARMEAVLGEVGAFSAAAIGAQAQQRDFTARGEAADYLLPTNTRSRAAFAFAELPLRNQVHLEAGVRAEQVRVQGTSASDEPVTRTFTPFSASLGLVVDASKVLRLGLMLTSAARAPAQTELFARGPHDGPGTFETGDAALGLERANSLEASLRLRLSRVRLDGSVWSARFDNYIFGELSGRTCNEDGRCVADVSLELQELNYLQQDARFRGAELKGSVTVVQNSRGTLSAETVADTVRATLADGGNVPRIPPWRVSVGLAWASAALDAGVTWRHSARQTRIAVNESATAAYDSLDAHVSWRFRSTSPLELMMIGRNLGNTEQHNAVSFNKETVTMPGRELRLVLRATL